LTSEPKVGICRKGEISAEEVLRRIKKDVKGEAGAIGLFIGIVRGASSSGETVTGLSYEAYEEVVNEYLKHIRDSALLKEGVVDVQIYHVVDDLKVGEDIMFVAVAGKHRKEVFEALSEIVDRVKSEAPIFKKEKLANGKSYWVSEIEAERKYKEK
jgi:molybdopterin synthase catalytic subunit